MTFFIKYWEPILAALVTACTAWMLHSLDVKAIEEKNRLALAAQQANLEAKFALNRTITETSSLDYASKISALNTRLNDPERMRENYCVMPITSSPSSGIGNPSSKGYAEPHGIPVERLYNYAGTCEHLRIQVISLQDFINTIYTGDK